MLGDCLVAYPLGASVGITRYHYGYPLKGESVTAEAL